MFTHAHSHYASTTHPAHLLFIFSFKMIVHCDYIARVRTHLLKLLQLVCLCYSIYRVFSHTHAHTYDGLMPYFKTAHWEKKTVEIFIILRFGESTLIGNSYVCDCIGGNCKCNGPTITFDSWTRIMSFRNTKKAKRNLAICWPLK